MLRLLSDRPRRLGRRRSRVPAAVSAFDPATPLPGGCRRPGPGLRFASCGVVLTGVKELFQVPGPSRLLPGFAWRTGNQFPPQSAGRRCGRKRGPGRHRGRERRQVSCSARRTCPRPSNTVAPHLTGATRGPPSISTTSRPRRRPMARDCLRGWSASFAANWSAVVNTTSGQGTTGLGRNPADRVISRGLDSKPVWRSRARSRRRGFSRRVERGLLRPSHGSRGVERPAWGAQGRRYGRITSRENVMELFPLASRWWGGFEEGAGWRKTATLFILWRVLSWFLCPSEEEDT